MRRQQSQMFGSYLFLFITVKQLYHCHLSASSLSYFHSIPNFDERTEEFFASKRACKVGLALLPSLWTEWRKQRLTPALNPSLAYLSCCLSKNVENTSGICFVHKACKRNMRIEGAVVFYHAGSNNGHTGDLYPTRRPSSR